MFQVKLHIVPLDEGNASHTQTYTYPSEDYKPVNGDVYLLFKPGHYEILYKEK